jgi:phospholipid/cholesterol/gamma-HCH transport system permease protein
MTASSVSYEASTQQLICQGNWDISNLSKLKLSLQQITWPTSGDLTIDGSNINTMDSAGAWLLTTWQARLAKKGLKVHLQHFADEHQKLISIIQGQMKHEGELPKPVALGYLPLIGKNTIDQLRGFNEYLVFVGQLSYEAVRVAFHPVHWRLNSLTSVVYRNGYQALPIVALLSFMIGVVLTYQMGLQLKNYGANIYIVDLLGLAVLREFGPLLTAIMVAGRTGSAYTAQLGMMKINQEIDALNTLGVTPAELLLLPRIVGLVIALPLLAMWSNVFGVFGGMVMANNMLNITWYDFLERFPQVVTLKSLLIGLGKTPVFALIIASTGCFQGMQVEGSADSVGKNTTRSVVLAIFFIIVADAAFSVILSKFKL